MSSDGQLPEIDVDALEGLLSDGCVLVDVREDDEFVGGHIPGALHMPLGDVPDRFGEIPAEGTVYVVCALGGRSARAAEFLRANGIDAVNVAGGTQGWVDSGREVQRGSGTP